MHQLVLRLVLLGAALGPQSLVPWPRLVPWCSLLGALLLPAPVLGAWCSVLETSCVLRRCGPGAAPVLVLGPDL